MVFSYSAWDRCVDLARTSEEERARLWDQVCGIRFCFVVRFTPKAVHAFLLKIATADYSFTCHVIFFWNWTQSLELFYV